MTHCGVYGSVFAHAWVWLVTDVQLIFCRSRWNVHRKWATESGTKYRFSKFLLLATSIRWRRSVQKPKKCRVNESAATLTRRGNLKKPQKNNLIKNTIKRIRIKNDCCNRKRKKRGKKKKKKKMEEAVWEMFLRVNWSVIIDRYRLCVLTPLTVWHSGWACGFILQDLPARVHVTRYKIILVSHNDLVSSWLEGQGERERDPKSWPNGFAFSLTLRLSLSLSPSVCLSGLLSLVMTWSAICVCWSST